MRILFLSGWFPYPADNGSKLRIYNLLRGLASDHEISLLSFSDVSKTQLETVSLKSICKEVEIIPWKSFEPNSRRALLGYLSLTPRSIIDTYSPEMEQKVKYYISKDECDLVIASQITMASYARCFDNRPAVFEEIEVGVPFQQFVQTTSRWHHFRNGLTWLKHRNYLFHLLPYFRVCTVVSECERQLLIKSVPTHLPIEVIPNSVCLADYQDVQGTPQPNSIIFTGSFRYSANYDAMTWFLHDVYPIIKSKLPNTYLNITGDHLGLPFPTTDNVTLTGYVDDVRPLIASSWVNLAPIRIGGGTRLKILESMALRTPVVATSKGAEGLDVQNGVHLLIADDPSDYAEAVIRIITDHRLHKQLAENAFQLICEKYDLGVVMPHFLNLIEQAVRV